MRFHYERQRLAASCGFHQRRALKNRQNRIVIRRAFIERDFTMKKLFGVSIAALAFAGSMLGTAGPVSAQDQMRVHVGDAGLGFTVDNGRYYDRHHRRHYYSYPSDWRSYHHDRSWYRSHARWNDRDHRDFYRN
jgi:hypothetical protein